MLEAFENIPSLYVHIPFCKRKCRYCAFYSVPCADFMEPYVDRLVSEIRRASRLFRKPFPTAYIGGGNPGCLSPSAFMRICEAICENGRPQELTAEMNPESMKDLPGSAFDYISRLSLGIQSLSEQGLGLLGRNSSLEETQGGLETALKLREKHGFSLNLDLICCRGCDGGSSAEDLEKAMGYESDHISLYELTLEGHSPLSRDFEKGIHKRDEDSSDELLGLWRALEKRGYEHYEVSSFALEGRRCLHNLRYWNLESYLGLGSAAASTAQGRSSYRIESPCDAAGYAEGEAFSGYIATPLTKAEEAEEYAIMRLRTSDGLDLGAYSDRFGKEPVFPKVGHMSIENGVFRPEGDEGMLLGDFAALEFCLANSL